jgi:hypothetical protein
VRRALMRLQDQMRTARHLSIQDQVNHLNRKRVVIPSVQGLAWL